MLESTSGLKKRRETRKAVSSAVSLVSTLAENSVKQTQTASLRAGHLAETRAGTLASQILKDARLAGHWEKH